MVGLLLRVLPDLPDVLVVPDAVEEGGFVDTVRLVRLLVLLPRIVNTAQCL